MCPKVREKAARFPNYPSVEGIEKFRTFAEFDGRFTAPLYGYASAQDYWRENSSLPWLPSIRVPLYMLLAKDDPFCSPSCYPVDMAAKSRTCIWKWPRTAGMWLCPAGRDYYSEERIRDFVRSLW